MSLLNDKIEDANNSEHTNKDSGWLEIKEGANQFRVLTEPELMFQNYKMGICYHECGFEGTPKYMARVLDRKDNKVKLYKIPFKIFKSIAALEVDEDYKFEGFPMPYDIKLNAKNAGTKEVEYTVMPSPKIVAVGEEVVEFLSKQKPIKDVIKAMQDKNIENHKADGTWQKEQDRLEELRDKLRKGHVNDEGLDTVEYPEEQINAEDIPF